MSVDMIHEADISGPLHTEMWKNLWVTYPELVKELFDLIEEQSTEGGEALGLKKKSLLANILTKNMSDFIPFEMQSEIMKRLPVKSLIQFRSVSKQWKCLIDSAKFIKNYHMNHTNPQHHLLVRYELDTVHTYTSITDNNTFPEQKFPLTAPELLSLLSHILTLGSINGLLCFCGLYGDINSKTLMAVIWNPTLRKSVGVVIQSRYAAYRLPVVGFGACPDTSDTKLVKISVSKIPSMWEVDVFTLSTRAWKTVYTGAPFKSCDFAWSQDFVDGVVYFVAYDDLYLEPGTRSNYVISFDLKSDKFGEVCLPERLVHTHFLSVRKVNDLLGLLEYYHEVEASVCGVWKRKDGANELFTKIYSVKVEINLAAFWVLGFRNNGEVVMQIDDDDNEEYRIEVYDPLSGHINVVGINGEQCTNCTARSYMETLLLLDESDSTIH